MQINNKIPGDNSHIVVVETGSHKEADVLMSDFTQSAHLL